MMKVSSKIEVIVKFQPFIFRGAINVYIFILYIIYIYTLSLNLCIYIYMHTISFFVISPTLSTLTKTHISPNPFLVDLSFFFGRQGCM